MRVNIDVISVNLIRITLPLVTKNEQNNHDVDKKKKRKRKKTTVYLQTARAYIFDDLSKRNYVVKVLLDPGSQQTYIS